MVTGDLSIVVTRMVLQIRRPRASGASFMRSRGGSVATQPPSRAALVVIILSGCHPPADTTPRIVNQSIPLIFTKVVLCRFVR